MGEYDADILVDDKVTVELKAAIGIAPDNKAQLINYLIATDKKVGALLNVGPKSEINRKVFVNSKK